MQQEMLHRTMPELRFHSSLGRFTETVPEPKENPMIKTFIDAFKRRMDNNRQYRRLISEIESLNARDLQELRADPSEMKRQAWISVYGQARA